MAIYRIGGSVQTRARRRWRREGICICAHGLHKCAVEQIERFPANFNHIPLVDGKLLRRTEIYIGKTWECERIMWQPGNAAANAAATSRNESA